MFDDKSRSIEFDVDLDTTGFEASLVVGEVLPESWVKVGGYFRCSKHDVDLKEGLVELDFKEVNYDDIKDLDLSNPENNTETMINFLFKLNHELNEYFIDCLSWRDMRCFECVIEQNNNK